MGSRSASTKHRFLNIVLGTILLVPILSGCTGASDEADTDVGARAPAKQGDRWGYINPAGSFIIQPQYFGVGGFSGGLAPVERYEGHWDYIDTYGFYKIEAGYELAYPFTGGMAQVQVDGGIGFINTKGEIVIQPGYSFSRGFSEDLAAVQTAEGWSFISPTGETVIPVKSEIIDTWGFADGLAAIKTEQGWGYLDVEGNMAIPAEFGNAESFSEGFASVSGDWVGSSGFGLIDENGVRVVDFPSGGGSWGVSEGLAAAWTSENLWGFIDTSGNWVIPPAYSSLQSFSEGLAAVEKDGAWGFINTQGEAVIEPTYDQVRDFHEGLAAVWDGNAWGFVDRKGKLVIAAQYAEVGDFAL